MTTLSLSLPQDLLDEQEALLARIARCREKLNLAMQRARVALSLEDTAEVFFTEMVPWTQRGGAAVRSVVIRPSTTRLTAAARTTGALPPLPAAAASGVTSGAASAPAPVATLAATAAASMVVGAADLAAANEETALAFFQSIPWNPEGGSPRSGRSPWSSAGTSDFLRAATESAVRASKSKN
ncbi:hypothetical protein J8C02_04720 [Chloracidobacterium sp. MS 40/45]|uniref:hypothetical protein n=1 Tax=Chloracidobacterium aggregatum TaxID=2851959 RepID=UPI001B8BA714|nr:hypothetical protein [Chloracidobacterium aggregatum]QUW00802.1 hypothetical protein J8C02_04720 [Chloracidobacterium sp. MS 40/45]